MIKVLFMSLERKKMKLAIVSFNIQGDIIGEKIRKAFEADLYCKKNIENFNITKLTKDLMESYEGIIFISSTGIAVRSIAPYIKGKDVDPAVVVIDIFGKYVISLLSGHLGGANCLAVRLAKLIKAEPIITTATDSLKIESPDILAKDNSLVIDSLKDAKKIAALLVNGDKVAFIDEENKIIKPKGYSDNLKDVLGAVFITNKLQDKKIKESKIKTLYLIRKNIILGIGCKKDYCPQKMKKTVLDKLEELKIDKRSIKIIATAEVKKDEEAILELAKFLECDIRIYTKDQIKEVQWKYEGSDFVEKSVGVRAVCEPVVELSGGKLLTDKMKLEGMTLCVGKEENY